MTERSMEDIRKTAKDHRTVKELVAACAYAFNMFIFTDDAVCDHKIGTKEYKKAIAVNESWDEVTEDLEAKVVARAAEEGLLSGRKSDKGLVKKLEPFMKKYGYYNADGWWLEI